MNIYQDLLLRLQAAQSDEERAWITLQFNLDTQFTAVREAVLAAAVLHWFDREMLSFVLETPLAEAEFRILVSLPYVEEFTGRGWNIHEKTRDLLRDKLWQEDRVRYRKLSRRAATWRRKYQPADPVWRAEAVYHALLAGESRAVQVFIDLGIDWLNNFQYAALETLIRPVLNAVRADRLEGRAAAWTWFLQARLDYIFSRNHEAKAALIQALDIEPIDQDITANCTQTLGDLHLVFSELPQARGSYEAALPIYRAIKDRQGEANCIQALGRVHERLFELPQALQRYREALPIHRTIGDRMGEASCIEGLGNVHMNLYELPQARGRYEAALHIYRAIGARMGEANCIQALGNVHERLSEFPQARVRYEEALQIFRSIGDRLGEANCIMLLGSVAGEEGKLNEALAHFTDAVQRYGALGMAAEEARCYNCVGGIYNYGQRYPEALTAYNRAIELFSDVNYYTNRAEPHICLGDFSAAQRDLDAAAALNPDFHYLNFNRGRLALWKGQTQAALEYFNQAMVQQPEYGEFHLWRSLALAMSGAAWEEALQAGLSRTHLVRQIKEVAEALEKLAQTYGATSLEGLRCVLQDELAARTLASRE